MKLIKSYKTIFFCLLFFVFGISFTKLVEKLKSVQNDYFVNVSYKNMAKYYLMRDEVNCDTLYLKIPKEEFNDIQNQREQALNNNKDFTYVDSKLVYENESHDIKIKLKGDRFIHFENDLGWSFRVKVKNKIGRIPTKFSLHHPKTKNYIYEWLFHKILKDEGLISLDYTFYQIYVNGTDWGIYALEQHFDDQLLIDNNKTVGPIFRFKEDYGARFSDTPPISCYKSNFVKNKANKHLVDSASKLLASFCSGKVSITQAFDSKLIAKYFALTDLFSFHHGTVSKSLRLYYNPNIQKFEPIGFDGHFGTDNKENVITSEFSFSPISGWNYKHDSTWYQLFFRSTFESDSTFYKEYYNYLAYFSESNYLPKLLEKHQSEIDENMGLIYRDFPPMADHIFSYGPEFFNFNAYKFEKTASYIRGCLSKKNKLQVYFNNLQDSLLVLDMNNCSNFSLRIISININDTITVSTDGIVLHPQIPYDYKAQVFKTDFQKNDIQIDRIKVFYNVLGSSTNSYCKVKN